MNITLKANLIIKDAKRSPLGPKEYRHGIIFLPHQFFFYLTGGESAYVWNGELLVKTDAC